MRHERLLCIVFYPHALLHHKMFQNCPSLHLSLISVSLFFPRSIPSCPTVVYLPTHPGHVVLPLFPKKETLIHPESFICWFRLLHWLLLSVPFEVHEWWTLHSFSHLFSRTLSNTLFIFFQSLIVTFWGCKVRVCQSTLDVRFQISHNIRGTSDVQLVLCK